MGMERVTVEQNGERITLEVPEGTSDADIQNFLSGNEFKPSASVTPQKVDMADAAMLATPALAAVAPQIPGAVSSAYQTGKALASPAVGAAVDLGKTYLKSPGALFTDVAMSSMGLPPPVAAEQSYKGVKGTYDATKDFLAKRGQFAPPPTAPIAPIAPTSPAPFASAAEVPTAQQIAKSPMLTEMAARQGMPSASAPVSAAPAQSLASQIGSKFAPLAQRVAPVLQGAGKILAPAAVASELFYTSPEEQAQLKQMEQSGTTLKDWTKQKLGMAPRARPQPQTNNQAQINQMIREAAAKKAMAFPNQ
jgi:hypothetical protein